MNCYKSEIFFSGISPTVIESIQVATCFVVGKMPVNYLGVPLVSKHLSRKDCHSLIDKITARVKHWTAKFLSYAGKLQLLQSVISSLMNFWCR